MDIAPLLQHQSHTNPQSPSKFHLINTKTAEMPTSAPTWPSTYLVQAFYLLVHACYILVQAPYLVYAAIPNIVKSIYQFSVHILGIIYSGAIANVAWWVVAWLYGLQSLKKKDNEAAMRMAALCAWCAFFIALAYLDRSDGRSKAGISLLRLVFEAGCVVLGLCLLVVAVAAFVRMALIVAAL